MSLILHIHWSHMAHGKLIIYVSYILPSSSTIYFQKSFFPQTIINRKTLTMQWSWTELLHITLLNFCLKQAYNLSCQIFVLYHSWINSITSANTVQLKPQAWSVTNLNIEICYICTFHCGFSSFFATLTLHITLL